MKRALTPFDELADSAFVRIWQITPDVLPLSQATLYRKVKDGSFPKPVRLTDSVVAWKVGDLREWMAARQQADPGDLTTAAKAARKSVKARASRRAGEASPC